MHILKNSIHSFGVFVLMILSIMLLSTSSSWAMRCIEGGVASSAFSLPSANSSHSTSIGQIKVTNANQTAGNLLWESNSVSTTFTCYDDFSMNMTENAYLYLDDASKTLENLFKNSNLSIGVRYNGVEYPIGSTEKIDLGLLALSTQSNNNKASSNCSLIRKSGRCSNPHTISLTYSIYIKSKGTGKNLSTLNGRTFEVFQLDGKGGRNSNGNFKDKISDMTVNYIECVPVLTTQDVDLGTYQSHQSLNTILRRTPFSLSIKTEGKNCTANPFVARFSSNQKYNENTLTTSETDFKNKVAIQVFPAGDTVPLTLEKNIDLGYSNGANIIKNFEAGVLFLQKPQASGTFSSTLNYEVYFK